MADDVEKGGRRRSPALVGGVVLGAFVALFAILNSQSVQVHWLVRTTTTPLIVVIVMFGAIGFGAGWLLARRRAGRGG
jgi:uncharacterized integral membrane protein